MPINKPAVDFKSILFPRVIALLLLIGAIPAPAAAKFHLEKDLYCGR
jgi:hypothetical protein